MKKMDFKQVIHYFENSCLFEKADIFYKNEDGDFIRVEPVFDEHDNLDDLEDEDNISLKEEMPLSKLINLEFYFEEVNK